MRSDVPCRDSHEPKAKARAKFLRNAIECADVSLAKRFPGEKDIDHVQRIFDERARLIQRYNAATAEAEYQNLREMTP